MRAESSFHGAAKTAPTIKMRRRILGNMFTSERDLLRFERSNCRKSVEAPAEAVVVFQGVRDLLVVLVQVKVCC